MKLNEAREKGSSSVTISYYEVAIILSMHDRISNINSIMQWLLKMLIEKKVEEPDLYPIKFYDIFERKDLSPYEKIFGKEMSAKEIEKFIMED